MLEHGLSSHRPERIYRIIAEGEQENQLGTVFGDILTGDTLTELAHYSKHTQNVAFIPFIDTKMIHSSIWFQMLICLSRRFFEWKQFFLKCFTFSVFYFAKDWKWLPKWTKYLNINSVLLNCWQLIRLPISFVASLRSLKCDSFNKIRDRCKSEILISDILISEKCP